MFQHQDISSYSSNVYVPMLFQLFKGQDRYNK